MDMTPYVIAIGLLANAILGLVKHFTKGKPQSSSLSSKQQDEMYEWTKELHRLHNTFDPDTGAPVWWVNKTHSASLKSLAESYEELSRKSPRRG